MDIANTFVGPFITKVADYTVTAVGRQLGYIFSYKKNLVDLDEKHVDLVGLREKVQNVVDVEKSKHSKIHGDVEDWLKKVNKFIELHKPKMSEDNESDSNKMSPHCLNLIQRHKLGRKAKKMVEEINKIIEKGNTFDKVGYLLPLQNIECSSISGYQSITSRMSIAKDIRDALADTSNSKVGIHGMGGVGKSTLVMEVERLLKEDKLFDQAITVTIGQSMDVKAIQRKIIDMSRWNFEVRDEKATAALIRNNLMEMKNKILIVLDDLWKELKLEDVGIPGGCKILITSREKDVLRNDMGVETNFIFEVKSLSETEAWEFFKNRIGEIDNTSIEEIAKNVAKECGGLPIALDTVGKTLKGKILPIWRDALKQLQNPTAGKVKGVTTKVYGSLRLSYDFIQNDEARLIFLLCSVFPDDYEIPLETLSMYAMGMRLFNGVYTWEEARDRMETLVDVLKSSSLLLESDNDVKMHDVVRDVAIYISSEEGCQMSTLCCGYEENDWKEKCGSYRAIFANCDGFHNLPQDLNFPKLELLILIDGYGREELLQIPETFFAGMKEVKVLDLSSMRFPQLTTSLKNLRTLSMEECEFRDIEIIGEFKEIEVLRMDDCEIKELPETMSQLTKLKVLNVSGVYSLVVIPPDVISKMMNLEELSLLDFKGWGEEVVYKGKSIQNAKLLEFKYLPHLTSLNLTIPCVNSLSDLSFSVNLKLDRFCIRVGDYSLPSNSLRHLEIQSESEIVLNDDVDKILLKRCDELRLKASRDISNLLFETYGNYGYPHLRHLSLESDSDMRHVIGDQPRNCDVNYFSSLDTLNLQTMESLENIVHMDIRRPNHFNKLRVINVKECKQLKNLFSFLVFEGLSNLHTIEVSRCDLMDGLILIENEEGNVKTKCSIVSLKFGRVPQLMSFCSKKLTNQHRDNLIPFFDDQIAFPELERLVFEGASNLKMLRKNNGMISNSFCKLQRIDIIRCDNLRYMFPSSAMTTLVSLEVLFIQECKSLEAIFEMEETYIVKDNDVALPLSDLRVDRCPKLKSVFPTSIKRLQQLQTLEITGACNCKLFSEDKTLEIAQSNSSSFHEDQIVFPNLTILGMDYEAVKINRMRMFCRADSFPKLKILGGSDDDDWISLPIGLRQLLFSTEDLQIKEVSVWKDNTDIWKMFFDHLELPDSIKLNSFPNLKSLRIEECNGLKNMLNSSVVKRLVNLEKMFISDCRGMISIVDGDGDDEEEEIIFNKLVELKLLCLERLESFHSGKSKLMFPCLEKLSIIACNEMKIFSNGIISKPKLQDLNIHGRNFFKEEEEED